MSSKGVQASQHLDFGPPEYISVIVNHPICGTFFFFFYNTSPNLIQMTTLPFQLLSKTPSHPGLPSFFHTANSSNSTMFNIHHESDHFLALPLLSLVKPLSCISLLESLWSHPCPLQSTSNAPGRLNLLKLTLKHFSAPHFTQKRNQDPRFGLYRPQSPSHLPSAMCSSASAHNLCPLPCATSETPAWSYPTSRPLHFPLESCFCRQLQGVLHHLLNLSFTQMLPDQKGVETYWTNT